MTCKQLILGLAIAACSVNLGAQTNPPKPLCEITLPIDGVGHRYYWIVDVSKNDFSCLPVPLGTGTIPAVRTNAFGITVWWYCDIGRVKPSFVAATHEWVKSNFKFSSVDFTDVQKNVGPIKAMLKNNIKTPIDSPELVKVWCPHAKEIWTVPTSIVSVPLPPTPGTTPKQPGTL